MNNHMKTGDAGLALIKHFEGFRAKAYVCPAGILTIGYGTTSCVRRGQIVSEAQAEALLRADVVKFEKTVKDLVRVALTHAQFDALVSFVYNVGPGNFRSSTLLKKINAGLLNEVPAQMMRWNRGGGRVLAGLTTRRNSEGQLFSDGSLVF